MTILSSWKWVKAESFLWYIMDMDYPFIQSWGFHGEPLLIQKVTNRSKSFVERTFYKPKAIQKNQHGSGFQFQNLEKISFTITIAIVGYPKDPLVI